jgi:hypothetical protein
MMWSLLLSQKLEGPIIFILPCEAKSATTSSSGGSSGSSRRRRRDDDVVVQQEGMC